MAKDNLDDLDGIDQEIRINELQEEAKELAGGEMFAWENEDCPPGITEAFWRRVVNYEKAPLTCHHSQIVEAGIELPNPHALSDEQVTAKLWEIIRFLAERRTFLSTTNHLGDRELLVHLLTDVLLEQHADLPTDAYSASHIDLLSSGAEEDTYRYMKYFADADERARWMESFPDYEMPKHVDSPFDRDRHLPQATYGDLNEAME